MCSQSSTHEGSHNYPSKRITETRLAFIGRPGEGAGGSLSTSFTPLAPSCTPRDPCLCTWAVPLPSPCFTLTFSKSCPKIIFLMALPASEEWTRTEVCASSGSGHLGMDFLSQVWEQVLGIRPGSGVQTPGGHFPLPRGLGILWEGAWSQYSQSGCPIKKCFPHLNVCTHYPELVKT